MFCLGELLETNHEFFDKQWELSKTANCNVLLHTKGFVTCIHGSRITLNYQHVFDETDLKRLGERD
jgi:hypothetical protein